MLLPSADWLKNFLDQTRPVFAESATSAQADNTPPISQMTALLGELAAALMSEIGRDHAADIWSIVGLGRDEVATARVLTWLLDPRGSHGLGDRYLQSLWQQVSGENLLGFALSTPERADREVYPIGNAENRVDIEVTGAGFLLLLEVKVNAGEGIDQIDRYMELARLKAENLRTAQGLERFDWAVLYLSVRKSVRRHPHFLHLTWRDVAMAIRRAERGRQLGFSGRLAHSFARHVERFR